MYVTDLHRSLQTTYTDICHNLHADHQRNKARYDAKSLNTSYHVGDQIWLFVPSVKSGHTKKLTSLWYGPYTIIDRINSVNYKFQLISQPSKIVVVHQDHLTYCFGTPQSLPASPVSSPSCSVLESSPSSTHPLYSTVLARQSSHGGYTSSNNSSAPLLQAPLPS